MKNRKFLFLIELNAHMARKSLIKNINNVLFGQFVKAA